MHSYGIKFSAIIACLPWLMIMTAGKMTISRGPPPPQAKPLAPRICVSLRASCIWTYDIRQSVQPSSSSQPSYYGDEIELLAAAHCLDFQHTFICVHVSSSSSDSYRPYTCGLSIACVHYFLRSNVSFIDPTIKNRIGGTAMMRREFKHRCKAEFWNRGQ